MKRAILPEITYMRGLCMLGVIGIHVGSIALSNPQANIHLLALLEILSRFCVPAFFFLSAFGLFYHTSVHDSFTYSTFLKKRIGVVLIPYVIWTLFYQVYLAATSHNFAGLTPQYLLTTLLFGNGMYHLYFLVILLWFYLLMPLWRSIVRFILPQATLWLSIIFILQTAVNYWSSYMAGNLNFTNPTLQYMFSMRLNYWILFYIWIFLLGAVFAEYYESIRHKLWDYRIAITTAFIASIIFMLSGYYYVMDVWHYTRLEAIYTIHQLSPMGMFYTGAGTIYFLFFFIVTPLSISTKAFWQQIGDCSYGIYLIHPLILIWLTSLINHLNLLYTAPIIIGLYITTVCASYLATLGMKQLPVKARRIFLGN